MRDKSIFTDKSKHVWHLMERDDDSIVLYYTWSDKPGHWVVWDSLDNDGDFMAFLVDTEELMGYEPEYKHEEVGISIDELMTIDYCQNCETNPGIKREFQTIPGSGYSKTAIRYICDDCYTKNECCGWCGYLIDVDDAYTVRISEDEHYHDECWEKKTKAVLDEIPF